MTTIKSQRHVNLINQLPGGKQNFSLCLAGLTLAWAFLILLAFNFVSAIAGAQTQRKTSRRSDVMQAPIRLVLQASKKTVRAGEPVEVIAYLENVSPDKFFYVGNELGNLLIIMPYHYIELSIKDDRNKDVAIGRSAAAQALTNETAAEKLARAYTKLSPGIIHGVKNSDSIVLPLGQYRLTAYYREVEALRWTEDERRTLPIQVWTQPLVSNTIAITVIH